jgi:hypothetical protein
MRTDQQSESTSNRNALDESNFNYQFLGRLQQDCEYYLGHGGRSKKHLWAGDVDAQIAKMKEVFSALPEMPEWITLERIDQYQVAMSAASITGETKG